MTYRVHSVPVLALITMIVLPNIGLAEDWERNPLLTDRWRISVGSFFQNVDSDLAVSGASGGVEVPEFDFDQSLRLSDADTSFSAYARWRFGSKWSMALQFLEQNSSNTAILEHDIEWEGDTIHAGAQATGGVSSEIYRLFFGRVFSDGPSHEFGAGLGLHWLQLGAFLEGEFTLNDDSLVFERRSVSAGAPLPNLGAWYIYALSPRWALHARIDYFSASYKEYSGGLVNGAAGVTFQAWRNVGFGLDYNYFEIDVDVDSDSWNGSADFTRDGPFLYATFSW